MMKTHGACAGCQNEIVEVCEASLVAFDERYGKLLLCEGCRRIFARLKAAKVELDLLAFQKTCEAVADGDEPDEHAFYLSELDRVRALHLEPDANTRRSGFPRDKK